MIKNKKLLIGLLFLAFCVCCAVFGLGFKSKNIGAKADTISQPTVATATATTAKSTDIASDEVKEYQTVAQAPALDKPEIQIIADEETFESEESEEEIFEEDNSEDISELGLVTPLSLLPPTYKTITFKGYLQWKADDGRLHPLRNVQLQISDKTVYTDNDGYFILTSAFSIFKPIDIIAYAIDSNENIRIKNANGKLYSFEIASGLYASSLSATYPVDFPIDMGTEAGQAFQIMQAVITARDFAQEMMGILPSPVQVVYPSLDKDICCYVRNENTIHIIKDNLGSTLSLFYPHSYASWDVIMHEYGHHISYKIGINDSLGGTHISDHNDAEDRKDKDVGNRLAWAESWATVFGMIAQKYYFEKGVLSGIWTVGDSYYTAYNIVKFEVNKEAVSLGEACEQSIMAVLWDLFDDDVEENDTIALGYQGFWDITTKYGCTTFSKFVQNFYAAYPELIDDLGANLAYYGMAASSLTIKNVSDNTLPTVSWSGSAVFEKDDKYLLHFYDLNGVRIYTIDVADYVSRSRTIDEYGWNRILSAEGSYFYWTVATSNYHDDIYTGPYYSQKQKVEKPFDISIINVNDEMEVENRQWFKFVAPESGTYTFYTEGGIVTQGRIYSQLFNYDDYLISYGGKVTLYLEQYTCVYIKASFIIYPSNFIFGVKQE